MSQLKLTSRRRFASNKHARNTTWVEESDRNLTEKNEIGESAPDLWEELVQLSSRQQEKVSFKIAAKENREYDYLKRIGQLERALEQSLEYLYQLRQQLRDQQLLETQLASAEEIANVQQQAITELKQQLAQQQFSLARLQHARWELERERDRYVQIEQRNLALQEQIWQQHQQADESEAVVHYWRERYLESLQIAIYLEEALERFLPRQTVELSALIRKVKLMAAKESVVSGSLPSSTLQQLLQVSLPSFVSRQNP